MNKVALILSLIWIEDLQYPNSAIEPEAESQLMNGKCFKHLFCYMDCKENTNA